MENQNYFEGYEEQASEWVSLTVRFEKSRSNGRPDYGSFYKAEEIYEVFRKNGIEHVLTETLENYQDNANG